MNIGDLLRECMKQGYTRLTASSKVCHDIILKEISKSPYYSNVTIKGGVVLHNVSKDIRRATRDIDFDFIHYSLDDESILNFIERLNRNEDEVRIKIIREIETLYHQDSNGKRVNVLVTDNHKNKVSTKIDIGVHKNFDIKQEEYCFDLDVIGSSVKLYINSVEQIFIEKLKSLLRFGPLTTRHKDIFDFYYLINNTKIDIDRFNHYIDEIIYSDDNLPQINNMEDIIDFVTNLFNNENFIKNLNGVKNNWLQLPVKEVLNSILSFLNSLEDFSY